MIGSFLFMVLPRCVDDAGAPSAQRGGMAAIYCEPPGLDGCEERFLRSVDFRNPWPAHCAVAGCRSAWFLSDAFELTDGLKALVHTNKKGWSWLGKSIIKLKTWTNRSNVIFNVTNMAVVKSERRCFICVRCFGSPGVVSTFFECFHRTLQIVQHGVHHDVNRDVRCGVTRAPMRRGFATLCWRRWRSRTIEPNLTFA